MATAPDVRPELESGDRLTREEFHRRYCRRPDIRKAELINGVVYVPSPARWGKHGKHQVLVQFWLGAYLVDRPGIGAGDNDTVFLTGDNEVQPDAFLFRLTGPNAGAREREDGYIEGAPELVVEVAASSASYDLHDKKEAYRLAGVPEYVVWRVLDEQIDWFRLQNGAYVRIEPDADGVIESVVFPGLRLNVAAMLAGDRAAILSTLQAPPLPSFRAAPDNKRSRRSQARTAAGSLLRRSILRESPMTIGMPNTRTKGPTMNEALLDAFRHNTWATKHLLVFCQGLSEEQLTSSATGTSRGILAIFNHIILSDGAYLRRLAGSAPAWVDGDESADLDRLKARVEETEPLWEQLLSAPIDTERVVVVDEGAYEVRAGIFIAQALHHGNAHREQICAILTGLGIEPPDMQPWEYAWATGRIWERTPAG